jgi:hypothetical protein
LIFDEIEAEIENESIEKVIVASDVEDDIYEEEDVEDNNV